MPWRHYNPNPMGKKIGDCTVRAISCALGQSWEAAYTALCVEGFTLGDMPNADQVWGAYLRNRGWERKAMPTDCPDCYTIEDFCSDHPKGTYILALAGHVVCVKDGFYFDSWDSGTETPVYCWVKKEE